VSLRLRLLSGLAALVTLGLAAFGVGTYLSLEHFLVARLDEQLTAAARAAALAASGVGGPGGGGPGDGGRPLDAGQIRNVVGPGFSVEFRAADGTRLGAVEPATQEGTTPPVLPDHLTLPTAAPGPPTTPEPGAGAQPDGSPRHGGDQLPLPTIPVQAFTAPATGGGRDRVAVARLSDDAGAVVVAGSLHPITVTLHRLLSVELAVGAGVLLITVGLGLVLARQATHPLEEIATTADAIAAGDLARRVDAADERSEVGRVGVAFNAMLGAIQSAFARRDLTEAQLRQFVADASHELSTPLTSIRGYAELFRRGAIDEPAELTKAMDRIETEATRMGGLVDDLLLLAALDSGRPLRRESVDLARVAADAAEDLRAVAPERTVTLEVDGPVLVTGDEDRLRQVAANLTSNARRYTPAGTPVVVRARREDGAGVLEVADRGPGLDPEQAGNVFDRFYRVDRARSRAQGGTGLGLAIVASIAEGLGGRATVHSVPGEGATFSVAVPEAADAVSA